jgi:hypothetical protein
VDWQRVEQLARFHGVAGRLHSSLALHGVEQIVPDDVRRSLQGFRRMVLARNLLLTPAWGEIARAFDRASIPVVPLKGIWFIGRYCELDVRPLHDLDVLVQRTDAEAACRVLESLGYREIRQEDANGSARTQRAFVNRSHGAAVDLHWDLVNKTAYNCVYALPIEEVWARARRSDSEPHAWELAAEDLLLHTALHCAVHHGFTTLSQLIDLAEVTQRHARDLDWRTIAELATRYRVKHPLYFALMLSREFIPDGGVPQQALTALEPPIYRRLCFDAYLRAQRVTVDRRVLPAGRRLRWGKELKWAGWAGVIVADSFADSLRVSWRTLVMVSAESLRALRQLRRARAAA